MIPLERAAELLRLRPEELHRAVVEGWAHATRGADGGMLFSPEELQRLAVELSAA